VVHFTSGIKFGIIGDIKEAISSFLQGTKMGGREDIEKNAFACRWAFFECPTIVAEEST
jgi:hypothetical protein